jgi:predicted pyridoxine 5'-phosphate oxidase superfamily flavin-nucleotide-binding protein
MFDDHVREFLQKPLVARLSTNGPDGYPNTVPVWFGLDGEEMIVVSERRLQKVKNLKRDPKGCLQIGGGENEDEGYLIRGTFSITDDVGNVVTNRLTYHYEDAETAAKHIAEWSDFDMVILRMHPVSVTKVL